MEQATKDPENEYLIGLRELHSALKDWKRGFASSTVHGRPEHHRQIVANVEALTHDVGFMHSFANRHDYAREAPVSSREALEALGALRVDIEANAASDDCIERQSGMIAKIAAALTARD